MNDPSRPPQRGFGVSTLRDPIERRFGSLGRIIYRRAWLTIALVFAGVGALCTQIPNIVIDTSTEGFLQPDDPIRMTFAGFRERFGRDQAVMVAVETTDVFDLVFLAKLRALHEEIESGVPNLQDVTSLVNVRNTRGEGDELIVKDLLEDWPENQAEVEQIRERVRANPLYVDQLISRDERITTILAKPDVYSSIGQEFDALEGFDSDEQAARDNLEYLTGEENSELVAVIHAIAQRHEGENFRILIAGVPVMIDRIMRAMVEDMARFTALSLVVIGLFLALLFRRVAAVILPVSVSGLAMLSTVSIMAMIGVPISSTTQITPSFLLAVGVGGAVHILVIFYQSTARGECKEDAIAFAMQHSGLAVLMTSLTTAAGLLSFVSADIAPVVDLGIITPIGIMASLVFSLILLPALVAVFPMKSSDRTAATRDSATRRALIACGDWATSHAWRTVGLWAVLLLTCILGATRLELSHDPVRWFAEDDPLRIAIEELNEKLNGTMYVDALIDTGVENGAQTPDFMNRIEEVRSYVEGLSENGVYVGKTISIADVVKETHQALNENRPEFYVIPQDKRLLAQELLLFENSGSDDLEDLVDSQFRETRFTMKMPLVDAVHYARMLGRIEAKISDVFEGVAQATLTGEARMMSHLISILSVNLMKTYALAFAVITPLMMLLLGSVRMGLLSMIPNLAPVIVTLGFMGWFGIPLEVFTILIGSIALGLAVDDTIHFMHNFRRYYERSGDAAWATRETLGTTGQALLFTTVVLSSGFFIYMFASMSNLFYFGLLTGITILVAFLADLLLAPALMVIYSRQATAPDTAEPCAEVPSA